MPAERHGLIVTGASSGIGRELVRIAADRGYAILAIARRRERLESLRAELQKRAPLAILVADITAAEAPARIAEAARAQLPRIDIVLHNAGSASPGDLLAQSDARLVEQWELHLGAPLRITRALLPELRLNHGLVALLGSGLARVPAPGYGAYCAAKAAVRAAATQLRRELRNDGIMVSYVDPGAVDTEFSQASGISRNERSSTHTPPQRVARAILDGLEQRRAIVNAQPLQSFAVALGERFPRLADFAFERFAERPRAAPLHIAPADPLPTPREESDELSTVLGPLARRMERVKLPTSFVRRLLVDEATIDLNETAMRWAGMPNKNERAALSEVFGALVVGGYLAQLDEQHFRVLRAAETLDGDGEKE